MIQDDKVLQDIAEHVLDIAEETRQERIKILCYWLFLIVSIVFTVMHNMLPALLSLVAALAFLFLSTINAKRVKLIQLHVSEITAKASPKYVKDAAATLETFHEVVGLQILGASRKLRDERKSS